jgi:hypothetical protein
MPHTLTPQERTMQYKIPNSDKVEEAWIKDDKL